MAAVNETAPAPTPGPRPGLRQRADAYGRRHPAQLLALTLLLAIIVTVVLLSSSEAPVVLYQAF